ncbi:MAG: succinylglutamate desuccinylase/aspartoacylase family protein [Acidobacteria bacterium]|nr:succinylglutamate desuccinylase/aspartoacylase family protein [Acidobacteriota bacterium]
MTRPLRIGGVLVRRGQRRRLEIPVARLPTGTALSLPVTALRGKFDGPTVWLSAALHGDEINGTEIIRRVVNKVSVGSLRGALITVPIVNVYGFIERSRYLPDRRDLNRSFPGSRGGSLASRLAHLFLKEVVSLCSHGIDFHTGAQHRTNLPHVRADLGDSEARRLATAFGAPLMFDSARIKGSLRAEAYRRKIPILVFEGGQTLEFAEDVISVGVEGTLRVLAALGMVEPAATPEADGQSAEATTTRWLRAGRSGILHLETSLGDQVAKGDLLAWISDPFSGRRRSLRAPFAGVVFAQTTTPLVYQGDAILRLARVRQTPGLTAQRSAGKLRAKVKKKRRSPRS